MKEGETHDREIAIEEQKSYREDKDQETGKGLIAGVKALALHISNPGTTVFTRSDPQT